MSTLKKLFAPAKEMKFYLIFYLVSSVYFGLLNPIFAIFTSRAIEGFETKNMQYFKTYLFAFLLVVLGSYAINHFIRVFRKNTPRIFAAKLYEIYIKKYLEADNNKTEILGTGQANSIVGSGCEHWTEIVMGIISGRSVRVLTSVFFGVFLIINSLGWITSIMTVIIVSIILIISLIGNKLFLKTREEKRDVHIQLNRNIIRIIMSKFEILQNNKVKEELDKIGDFIKKILKLNKKESKGYILATDIPRFIVDIIKVGVLAWFGFQIMEGRSSFAEFTLIWLLLNQLGQALFDINEIISEYNMRIVHVEKLRNLFDQIPMIEGYDTGEKIRIKEGKIDFKGIELNYGERNVLENISISIAGGQKVAFVGESGAGKTSLIKLAAGYIHPNKGEILVDGQLLRECSLKSYYNNIGYLTQDPNVFDGSIMDNLLSGTKTKISKAEIEKAIKLSKCEFIYEFKDGLQTQIGEKGVRLSGGQKQRLAIAKLFIKNPSVVFLDEPTSALDSISEEQITKALDNLFKNRTVLIVAHRLQTVKSADIIYLLSKGKIIEQGTHIELIRKKGAYNKMVELQSGF